MIIYFILTLQAHSQRNFFFFIPGWRKQYQKGKLKGKIAGNGQLQYLFQK